MGVYDAEGVLIMLRHFHRNACCSLVLTTVVFISHGVVRAQEPEHRLEIGGQITSIQFSGLGESGLGVGIRGAWRAFRWLALETELNRVPENPGGNFGQTLLASGVRLGLPIPPLELAVKVKPGGVHFGGRLFQSFNPQVRWKPALDVGSVLLFRPRRHVAVRVDVGDLLIFYGSSVVATPLQSPGQVLGTTHNRQISVGIQLEL